jgi:small subunit ribosomal protein S2
MPVTDVDIKKLFEAGAHFGHKTSRWHPKMGQYIHSSKNGSHIIDLTKTVELLEPALKFLEETAASGKQVLFVGTKKQAHDTIKELAESVDMPYVSERWLGGMITNSTTIGERVKHLKDLELKMSSGQLASKYGKLEVQRYQEEIDAMNHLYGGIKNLAGKPGALFIVDIIQEANAVKEAKKLHVPIVAIVDTNANPSLVDFPIPANDDAIKTIKVIGDYVTEAIKAGKANKDKKTADKAEAEPAKAESK